MKTILILLIVSSLISVSAIAQKPSFSQYKKSRSEIGKLTLESLKIPDTAGVDMYPQKASKKKNSRFPASLRENVDVTIRAACTSESGMNVSNADPAYGKCIDKSSSPRKVILNDPTQSVFMNIQIDKFDLNPFVD